MVKQSGEPFLPPCLCCFSHTAQSLGHSFPALCRLVLDRAMFSLVRALPSPASAKAAASLFDWFIGTMAQSDSSRTCMSALWLIAFADRSRSWLERNAPEVSRFSCMLFLDVRGFLDYAGPASHWRFSWLTMLPSPLQYGVGAPDSAIFEAK